MQTACLGSLCDSRMARTQAGDITTASPMPYLLCHHVISVTQVTSSLPSLLLHYIILGKKWHKKICSYEIYHNIIVYTSRCQYTVIILTYNILSYFIPTMPTRYFLGNMKVIQTVNRRWTSTPQHRRGCFRHHMIEPRCGSDP